MMGITSANLFVLFIWRIGFRREVDTPFLFTLIIAPPTLSAGTIVIDYILICIALQAVF